MELFAWYFSFFKCIKGKAWTLCVFCIRGWRRVCCLRRRSWRSGALHQTAPPHVCQQEYERLSQRTSTRTVSGSHLLSRYIKCMSLTFVFASLLSLPALSLSSRGHVLRHVAAGGEPGAAGRAGPARGPAGSQPSRPGRARHQVRCNQWEGKTPG